MGYPETLYGPWQYGQRRQQFPYDDTPTYEIAAAWLDGFGLVEDWGCGVAWAKQYFKESQYRGIDGAWSLWADEQVDLRKYRSDVECIMMRHVLEHNADWRTIAENLAHSFTERAALVMFIPPQPDELDVGGPDWPVPDLAVSGPELVGLLQSAGPLTFHYQQLDYGPQDSIQWSWEGVLLMERP